MQIQSYHKVFVAFLLLISILPVTATNYYVDNVNGSDNNNGLSPGAAWQSLNKVSGASLVAGDSVLFIRGGTWRGQLLPKSGTSAASITYSAYGSGAKPLLLGSVNKSDTSDWVSLGGNIWQSKDTFHYDVGNIIFDNEASVGFKKWSDTALTAQGYFWYDKTATRKLKIYSTSNPGSYYSNIELALGNFIVYAQLDSFFVLQDLAFKYGAADGIEIRNTRQMQLLDCDLSYIGGTELNPQQRYGGGIQFWAYSNNNTVERCRFWEIYDDAVTNQCTPSNPGPAQQYNIFYRNNVIWNCSESSYCCDLRPATLTGSFLKNIYFENNTCVNAGGGWAAAQRPDPKGFQIYFSAITAPTDSIFIRNNVFYKSRAVLFVDNSSVQTLNYTDIDYNDWYARNSNDTIAALWTSSSLTVWTKAQFANYQTTNNKDLHSIMADPLLADTATNNYHLKSTSPCRNAGINAGVPTDFELNARPLTGPYDIGAYQHVTTSLEPLNYSLELHIYPVPSKDIFYFDGLQRGFTIEVYNTLGERVYSAHTESDKYVLSLGGQPRGMYIYKVSDNATTIQQGKIIVE